mgnify:CR=1 FL=1
MADAYKAKEDPEALAKVPSQNGEVSTSTHDAVFGAITEDGPNYRNVIAMFPFRSAKKAF